MTMLELMHLVERTTPWHVCHFPSLCMRGACYCMLMYVPQTWSHMCMVSSMTVGRRSDDSPADQMKQAAKGADLLETWLILEHCDQGSFDHAIRAGKFANDLVRTAICCTHVHKARLHEHSDIQYGTWHNIRRACMWAQALCTS